MDLRHAPGCRQKLQASVNQVAQRGIALAHCQGVRLLLQHLVQQSQLTWQEDVAQGESAIDQTVNFTLQQGLSGTVERVIPLHADADTTAHLPACYHILGAGSGHHAQHASVHLYQSACLIVLTQQKCLRAAIVALAKFHDAPLVLALHQRRRQKVHRAAAQHL